MTSVCCVYENLSDGDDDYVKKEDDGEDEDEVQKIAQIVAVGWDKRVHIWNDEKEEEVESSRELPR